MSPIDPFERPLRISAVEDEVVFLGEGRISFSMTRAAARLTFYNLAEALLASTPPRPGGPTVVLLVENEPFLREIAAMILGEAGFLVIATEGPRAALRILESGERIHLLFTSIQMPGEVDGLQLAHQVRDRWPTMPVLLTSGHGGQPDEDIPDGGRFLPKPYMAAEVVRHITELTAA
jgi:CheY-like chemotaxis protein